MKLTHYDLQNYTLYYTDSKTGGDVALYVSNKLNCKKIETLSIEKEGIFELIRAELIMPKCKNIVVTCCYRAPSSPISIFIDEL